MATATELELSAEQNKVLAGLSESPARFKVNLLYGVTGSGKTEIYIRRCRSALECHNSQVLILTPEIGLTPQLYERFEARFGEKVSTFHSGMTERQRADVWTLVANGQTSVVVGTRSAIFLPFSHLSLIVVDEEHDASFKQQEGFRYSARDVAIVRAKNLNIPVILGSATPSLETLHNVRLGRYQEFRMQRRAAARCESRLKLIDRRLQKSSEGLSDLAVEAISSHLSAGGQVLVFINRRGFAPVLMCSHCAWRARCLHCNAHMAMHRQSGQLRCHHCGSTAHVPHACPDCGAADLFAVGQGTERIEEELARHFPDQRIERIDSDRMRRAGELARVIGEVRSGRVNIIVGTQMLSKGHDFRRLSLVCVVDADQALFSIDFRSTERLAQMLTQVAGRAGRHALEGEVLVQTHEPEHPVLKRWMQGGYDAVTAQLLEERTQSGLPPVAYLAMIRADALDPALPGPFLERVASQFTVPGVEILGPVAAPMERRANRTRAQLLFRSANRGRLQGLLAELVPRISALPGARKLRWSVDVDPVDLF